MTRALAAAALAVLFQARFAAPVSLRVSKPRDLGPYLGPPSDTTPYMLNFPEVFAFSVGGPASPRALTSCSSSSFYVSSATYNCFKAFDGSVSTNFNSGINDLAPWVTFSAPGALVGPVTVKAREGSGGCCNARSWHISVDVLDAAGAVAWGATDASGENILNTLPAVNFTIPNWVVRVSKPASGAPYADANLVLAEIGAFGAPGGGGANRASAALGCRLSVTANLSAAPCARCADGDATSACNATGAAPWALVGVGGGMDAVLSVVVTPAAGFPAGAAGALVELVYAPSGIVYWRATLPAALASAAPVVLNVSGLTVVRVSKPAQLYNFRMAYPQTTPVDAVEVAEVQAFGAGDNVAYYTTADNFLLGAAAWGSSVYGAGGCVGTFTTLLNATLACDGSTANFQSTCSGDAGGTWIAIAVPPAALPSVLSFIYVHTRAGFAARSSHLSVDVVSDWPLAPKVVWGTTLGAVGATTASVALPLPTYTIRVSQAGASGVQLALAEIGAFSANSSVNRATGGACRASSFYATTAAYLCASAVDGSAATMWHSEGSDAAAWAVFSLAGSDPVARITFLARQDGFVGGGTAAQYASRYANATVELLYAPTGRVLFTATLGAGTVAPVPAPPAVAWGLALPYAVVLSKPAAYVSFYASTADRPINVGEVAAVTAAGATPLLGGPAYATSQTDVAATYSFDPGLANDGVTAGWSFYHSQPNDVTAELTLLSLDATSVISAITVWPRVDCCQVRMTGLIVELMTQFPIGQSVSTSAVSWGVQLGAWAAGNLAPLTLSIPAFSVRVSKPASLGPYAAGTLNLGDVAAASVGGGANRALGQPCRMASFIAPYACASAVDGSATTFYAAEDYGTGPGTNISNPWLLVALTGADPVATISITPRQGNAAMWNRLSFAVVELLRAATGQVIWSTRLGAVASGSPVVLVIPTPSAAPSASAAASTTARPSASASVSATARATASPRPTLSAVATCAPGTRAARRVFPYSGTVDNFTMPAGVASAFVQLYGAGGSGGHYASGGGGAYVSGALAVLPAAGVVVYVAVGGGGQFMATSAPLGGQAYAHPSFYSCGGTGAGATAVGLAGETPLAVAGAGGSGGENWSGGAATWDGSTPASTQGAGAGAGVNAACAGGLTFGGFAASASAPGARGCGSITGSFGNAGTGPLSLPLNTATGSAFAHECGGLGGGGFFGGGGGGWWVGGGAGSSFSGGLVGASGESAAGALAGGSGSAPGYDSSIGAGGPPMGNGGNGLAIVTLCAAPPQPAPCPPNGVAWAARYSYTGALGVYTIHPNATGVFAQLWGGGGSGGRHSSGGGGAYVAGALAAPRRGASLLLAVGGAGLAYPTTVPQLGGRGISHPSNFQCAGTGAGATALGAAGAAPLAVAGAGGSGGEHAFGNGGAARWDGQAGAAADGGVKYDESNAACVARGPGIVYAAAGATSAGAGAGGCGLPYGLNVGGSGPLTLPAAHATGGASIRECGGVGGGGAWGGGAGAWHDGGAAGASSTSGLAAGASFVSATTTAPFGLLGESAAGAAAGGRFVAEYVAGVAVGGGPYASGGAGAAVLSSCALVCPASSAAAAVTFRHTNGMQYFTAPANVATVWVQAWGAGGTGGRYSSGGGGAYVTGYLSLAPGTTLTIVVGGGGVYMGSVARFGGRNYSAPNNYGCTGTGAGASAVARADGSLVVVAGAGGGGGESVGATGGGAAWDGTAPSSTNGVAPPATNPACLPAGATYGGLGATATAPGARGCGSTAGTWGAAGTGPLTIIPLNIATGGAAGAGPVECGGLGGAGLYGGGSGGWHGGGASGSSYAAGVARAAGESAGAYSPAGFSAPNYVLGTAAGGPPVSNGGDGLVVLTLCVTSPTPSPSTTTSASSDASASPAAASASASASGSAAATACASASPSGSRATLSGSAPASPSASGCASASAAAAATRAASASGSAPASASGSAPASASSAATASATATLSATPTASATATPTPTATPTASTTLGASASVTGAATVSPTSTPPATDSPSTSATPSPSPTPSDTAPVMASPTSTTSTLYLVGSPAATSPPAATGSDTTTPSGTASPTPTASPSGAPPASSTPSLSRTPTRTPTASVTNGASASGTATVSESSTTTESVSATPTQSPTPTGSGSGTAAPTPSATPSGSDSGSTTGSLSTTPSATPSTTLSTGGTASGTPSPASTPPPTPSPSLSASQTGSATASGSPTGTATPSTSGTASQTPSTTASLSASLSGTATPSVTLGASASETPSVSGTASATSTLSSSNTPTASATATGTPTASDTPSSTASLSRSASRSPTASLTVGASPSATGSDSGTGSATSAASGSQTPTATATGSGTGTAALTPSPTPTGSDSGSLTISASTTASAPPTPPLSPGASPSTSPSAAGTPPPTGSVTASRSASATPTSSSTATPSGTQTQTPSATLSSGASPSISPSAPPTPPTTATVSGSPTLSPTASPPARAPTLCSTATPAESLAGATPAATPAATPPPTPTPTPSRSPSRTPAATPPPPTAAPAALSASATALPPPTPSLLDGGTLGAAAADGGLLSTPQSVTFFGAAVAGGIVLAAAALAVMIRRRAAARPPAAIVRRRGNVATLNPLRRHGRPKGARGGAGSDAV